MSQTQGEVACNSERWTGGNQLRSAHRGGSGRSGFDNVGGYPNRDQTNIDLGLRKRPSQRQDGEVMYSKIESEQRISHVAAKRRGRRRREASLTLLAAGGEVPEAVKSTGESDVMNEGEQEILDG
ncbi:Uncharacterized protein Y057_6392 [Fusarium fujikuroi]|nr:Uncharacterized protein Y057_6392 [Fusarium fujikuroi]